MSRLIILQGFDPAGKPISLPLPRLEAAFKDTTFMKNAVPKDEDAVALVDVDKAKVIDPNWASERPLMVGHGTLPPNWPDPNVLSAGGPDFFTPVFNYLTLDENEEPVMEEPGPPGHD